MKINVGKAELVNYSQNEKSPKFGSFEFKLSDETIIVVESFFDNWPKYKGTWGSLEIELNSTYWEAGKKRFNKIGVSMLDEPLGGQHVSEGEVVPPQGEEEEGDGLPF